MCMSLRESLFSGDHGQECLRWEKRVILIAESLVRVNVVIGQTSAHWPSSLLPRKTGSVSSETLRKFSLQFESNDHRSLL